MRYAPALLYGVIAIGAPLACSSASPLAPPPGSIPSPSGSTSTRSDGAKASLDSGASLPVSREPAALGVAEEAPAALEVAEEAPAAPAEPSPQDADFPIACAPQPPQDFLIRTNYIDKIGAAPEETARRKQLHREAIEYRTRRYGFVRGFGSPEWNPLPPVSHSELTTFFGIKIRLNKRIIPALQCVEQEIRRSCAADVYEPHLLDGIRFRNTFHDGEITNHAFGIAIDVDPDRNSCCHCVPPLNTWPRCLKPTASPYDRARIPRCWVQAFTKYGFYWLGNDPLEDTMHFEFLGDPDRILSRERSF